MARTREFEDSEVLERAMRLFWEKGYEHSSLKELLAVMQIQNGSFYNTFGNKKNLFIQTLENYYADLAARRRDLFERPMPFSKKIRSVFRYALHRQTLKDCPRGCFIVNSMSADVLEDPDLRTFLLKYSEDFADFLKIEIRKAIETGELDGSIDPELTATVVNTFFQGMLKMCVVDFSEERYLEQTEYFLTSLKL